MASRIQARRSSASSREAPASAMRAASRTMNPNPPEPDQLSNTSTRTSSATMRAACTADSYVPLSRDEMCTERIASASGASLRYTSTNSPGDGWDVLGMMPRSSINR